MEQPERHREVSEQFCAHILAREELDDGYAYRFPGEDEVLQLVTEFVRFERHCCPFFTFELLFEPELGPFTLRMRGPEGTKAFLEQAQLVR